MHCALTLQTDLLSIILALAITSVPVIFLICLLFGKFEKIKMEKYVLTEIFAGCHFLYQKCMNTPSSDPLRLRQFDKQTSDANDEHPLNCLMTAPTAPNDDYYRRINLTQLVIDNLCLGLGAFGVVHLGTYKKDDGSTIEVTVKVMAQSYLRKVGISIQIFRHLN